MPPPLAALALHAVCISFSAIVCAREAKGDRSTIRLEPCGTFERSIQLFQTFPSGSGIPRVALRVSITKLDASTINR